MNKRLTIICVWVVLLGCTSLAQASLTTIGTATYLGSDYNLILDDNNNGKMVVWLDYTNDRISWSAQNNWAATLDSNLTINTPGYNVDWGTNSWRLPTGFPARELEDLWTNEFGFSFADSPYSTEDLKKGGFTHLLDKTYWTSTSYSSTDARQHSLMRGQEYIWGKQYAAYGLAIHTVNTAEVLPTPVPGAIWLLGSGLIALAGRKKRKHAKG